MSYFNYFQQHGGAKCSLCGSLGTNKSTCPLNPKAKNPNPSKHSLAKKQANKTPKKNKGMVTCKKGPGFEFLQAEYMTIGMLDTKLSEIFTLKDFQELTKTDLQKVVAFCPLIYLTVNKFTPSKKDDFIADSEIEVKAKNKKSNITVKDVLEAYLKSNQQFFKDLSENLNLELYEIPAELNYTDDASFIEFEEIQPGHFLFFFE